MTEEGQLRLIEEIEKYEPFNEMEERDKELILRALRREENVFSRENSLCHMTASAWISSPDRTKVLMAYHNIYDSWSWLGGHADGDTDLLRVALKEAEEESGLSKVKPLMQDIFSLEVLTVDGHVKNGSYVSSHLHLNITYLLSADDREQPVRKPDENKAVAWFKREIAVEQSSEPWFRERIYSKLNRKLEEFIRQRS